MTWPLAAGLTRDIPGDFGDPLFTSWVISWDATHLGRGWWNANIFAPQPLTLAYSEHFLPQALQVLPIYALTRNPILCYNLLFLSTFALSGLGMFLLGRELTGSRRRRLRRRAARSRSRPYRIASIAAPAGAVVGRGCRSCSSACTGISRPDGAAPLAGAAAAWLVQNLSCGYYLLFFSPVVVLYIGWELTRARAVARSRATLTRVGIAVAIVLARDGAVPAAVPRAAAARRSARDRSPKRGASPPTSMPTSPPIRTCVCGDRSRRRGRRPKGCCFRA